MNPILVAEVGGNHLGSLMRAKLLVVAASGAGADSVKFQCFTPEQMCAPNHVLREGPWKGRNLLNLYQQTHTPREWFPALFALARELNLTPFASVFHPNDVDFLMTLDCPMLKISSFELTDLDLIRHAAQTGKPLIISTGMGTFTEVLAAMTAAIGDGGCKNLTLLKCTSAYPADASYSNLATMVDMKELRYADWHGVQQPHVGLSDHTPGIGVAVAATALGATMIEKHLTLRRSDGGPDAAFSMEPEEFSQMVIECRRAAAAIGTVQYGPTEAEKSSLVLRRPPGGMRGAPRGTIA